MSDSSSSKGQAPGTGRPAKITADGRLTSGRLKGLSLAAAIWVLSWPILIESFLNSLVGLTDTVLAAGLGESETDAVGGASYFMWFIGLVIMALGVGATALISRSVGRGRIGVANAALGQTLTLGVVAGAAVGAFVALSSPLIARLLNMPPDAGQAMQQYLIVIGFGTPAAALLFTGIACARGAGDSVRPLQAMVVRNIVNILASFALSGVDITRAVVDADGTVTQAVVLANPFGFNLGVLGIAIGTVLGDFAGAAMILRTAMSGKWGIRLRLFRLKPHWHTINRIVRIGIPNFLETLGMWVGNFFVIVMVGWLGAGSSGPLGAHIVAIRLEAFSFLPGFAMGIAAATLAGQYLGAGSEVMARKAILWCTSIGAGLMGTIGIVFMVFPRQVVSLVSSQPSHLELAPDLMVICGAVQVPFGIAIVVRQALRGAGDVRAVLALTWITTYAIRLPAAFLLSGVDITWTSYVDGEPVVRTILENPTGLEPSLAGLWLGMCGELVLRGLVFGARFIHGGWTKAKV